LSAKFTARRTVTLSNGARLWLSTMLSLPFCPSPVTTIWGQAFFTVSAVTLVMSSGA
jgi:hypothetical protein